MKPYHILSMLLSPDEATPTEVDPLSEAAGGVDTSFPVLMPDRPLRFKCSSSKVAPTKNDATRSALTLVVETMTDTVFQDGKPCRSGFKIYKRYGVTPTPPTDKGDGRTIDNIKKDLSFLLKAFYGSKTTVSARDLLNRPEQLEGQVVDGKTVIEKGTGGFPDKSGVNFTIPADK